MTHDHWVTAALTNDTLVVELLLRLKQSSSSDSSLRSSPSPAKQPPSQPTTLLPPLGWGHRQPRTRFKPTTTLRKEREPTRCSPSTPLSWSGGGGAASTSDGSDPSSADRSKAAFGPESATTATNKKSRKRKTFAGLKEEEGFLLKERIHLKRELASIRVTLKEQVARSENLKRLKLDLHLHLENKKRGTSDEPVAENSYQCNLMAAFTVDMVDSVLPRHAIHDNVASSDSCKAQNDVKTQERGFVLPDLNMTPSEEESGSEILYGVS